MTESNNSDHYNTFLLEDFRQQYQEYRKEETSRTHYVQFFISLVVAVIAFFATLYGAFGFPASNIYMVAMSFFIWIILFFVGWNVTSICVSTRISQMHTAMYINNLADHFRNRKEPKLFRKNIYFADKDWDSEKTPFFGLMKILCFLLGAIGALLSFSSSRLAFYLLESSGLATAINLQSIDFWDYLTWSYIVSAIFGLLALILIYTGAKRKIHKQLQNEKGMCTTNKKEGKTLKLDSNDFSALSALLDFYSDRAVAHASFLIASIFGLFSILQIIGKPPSASFWMLTLTYWILWLVGLWSLYRFGNYATLADEIRFYIEEHEKEIYQKIKKMYGKELGLGIKFVENVRRGIMQKSGFLARHKIFFHGHGLMTIIYFIFIGLLPYIAVLFFS